MKTTPLPSQEKLHYLFYYNEKTGKFYARFPGRGGHPIGRNASTDRGGYFQWMIERRTYREHRLIWRYMTGEDPGELRVDHKDRDKSNNKFENLRLATHQQNVVNASYKGVSFHKASGKWQAQTMLDYKKIYLGLFDCPLLAHVAYCDARKELHGDFAPSY